MPRMRPCSSLWTITAAALASGSPALASSTSSALGEQAGLKVRPHGLRHTAITAALDAFNGDYRKTRAFSRHASLDTVHRYDDNRADHAGQVAQALNAIVG